MPLSAVSLGGIGEWASKEHGTKMDTLCLAMRGASLENRMALEYNETDCSDHFDDLCQIVGGVLRDRWSNPPRGITLLGEEQR